MNVEAHALRARGTRNLLVGGCLMGMCVLAATICWRPDLGGSSAPYHGFTINTVRVVGLGALGLVILTMLRLVRGLSPAAGGVGGAGAEDDSEGGVAVRLAIVPDGDAGRDSGAAISGFLLDALIRDIASV